MGFKRFLEPFVIVLNDLEIWLLACFKETKSVTMNVFRKKSFLFKSFVKVELSYVFIIKCRVQLKTAWKVNYLIKQSVGNYLRPSNNSRRLILT